MAGIVTLDLLLRKPRIAAAEDKLSIVEVSVYKRVICHILTDYTLTLWAGF